MKPYRYLTVLILTLIWSLAATSQQVAEETPLSVVSDTNEELAASQRNIDSLNNATLKLLQEYREILQRKDYQQYYNFQLKQLKTAQEQEIADLQNQLQELDYIEVAIMPLIQSMLVALEEFVTLDMPFHQQVRQDGLTKLRSRINSGGLSLPDKYRLIMEAWQIEHDYGRSIEAWRDLLSASTGQSEDDNLSVDYLRVGRTAFYYLTLDQTRAAVWHKDSRSWKPLPDVFIADLKRSIQIASERIAPELMPLPVGAVGRQQ